MTKLPSSYREIDTCRFCQEVFICGEYDSPDRLFCAKGAPERPLCGSVLLGEFEIDQKGFFDFDPWDEWAKDREVHEWGVCDEFIHEEKDDE